MRHPRLLLTFALAIVGRCPLTAQTPAREVILQNPAFDVPGLPIAGWGTSAGTLPATLDSEIAHSGPASLRLGTAPTGEGTGTVTQTLAFPAGARCKVGAWLCSRGAGKAKFTAVFLAPNGVALLREDIAGARDTAAWSQGAKELTAPAGTVSLALSFTARGAIEAWLDDVTLSSPDVKVVIQNPAPIPAEFLPEPEPADPAMIPITPARGFYPAQPASWPEQHRANLRFAETRTEPLDLLLLGDSITASWDHRNPRPGSANLAVWDKYFSRYSTLNFGIGGDKTQNLLWRLAHGELGGLQPKAVILAIGINNVWDARVPASAVAVGVERCVSLLREKLPSAKVVVVNVIPIGEAPDDPLRTRSAALAGAIRDLHLERLSGVRLLDFDEAFLDPKKRNSPALLYDFVHPTPAGYEIYAARLEPLLRELLIR